MGAIQKLKSLINQQKTTNLFIYPSVFNKTTIIFRNKRVYKQNPSYLMNSILKRDNSIKIIKLNMYKIKNLNNFKKDRFCMNYLWIVLLFLKFMFNNPHPLKKTKFFMGLPSITFNFRYLVLANDKINCIPHLFLRIYLLNNHKMFIFYFFLLY